MKFNFFTFLWLFSFLSLNATEIYWDGETPFNVCDCQTKSKRFIPDDNLKSIVFSINDVLLDIKESIDSFIIIQARGSKKKLNNIIFSKDHESYYLKEQNDFMHYARKFTTVTLYLPKSTCAWDFSFQGTGRGRIIIDKIYANTINAEISDNTIFKLLDFESSSLKFIGNNNAELCAVGLISDSIDLKSSGNSHIYIKPQRNNFFRNLTIQGQNYGKILFCGNGNICNDSYEINALHNSQICVEQLHVLALKSRIKIDNFSDVGLCCSFTTFEAFLNHSSKLVIHQFERLAKNFNADLKSENLHSKASVKQYSEFNLSDWVNKIIVDVQNSGQCTINMTRPMESTIITAQNSAKVRFLMPVARAKVTAKNNSEVSFVEVKDILEDNSSENAKIRADIQPLKEFVF